MQNALNRTVRRVPVWTVYSAGLLPIPIYFVLAAIGQMGPDPVAALEHRYGLLALQALVLGLMITPLRKYAGINLLRFRRAIGLIAFAYVVAHLLVWVVLDIGSLAAMWEEINERPYITMGMASFVLMLPLALTSNNASIRRLGAETWSKLHRLTYAAILLGALHFVMLSKGFQWEPLLYLAAALILVALRLSWPQRARSTS